VLYSATRHGASAICDSSVLLN